MQGNVPDVFCDREFILHRGFISENLPVLSPWLQWVVLWFQLHNEILKEQVLIVIRIFRLVSLIRVTNWPRIFQRGEAWWDVLMDPNWHISAVFFSKEPNKRSVSYKRTNVDTNVYTLKLYNINQLTGYDIFDREALWRGP